jgi:transcriptional regulator GlxA family with amidase domain
MQTRHISVHFLRPLVRQCHFNLHELAAFFAITPRQVQRLFQEEVGRTPQDWLDEQRVLAAIGLLREGSCPKAVAAELGFCDQTHLTRHFKKFTGTTPGKLQRTWARCR